MGVKLIKTVGTWRDVADACNTTIGKAAGTKEPSSKWKTKILRAEHSPIRLKRFIIEFTDLPYWVSVHLVRHKFGIEHFVKSQRMDRTGAPRDMMPQNTPVTHRIDVNTQALITISRKRMCNKAAQETRSAWIQAVSTLKEVEPEIYNACVPECMYRGFCPEFNECGFSTGPQYLNKTAKYQLGEPFNL